jgi:hypothetical protein
LAELAAIAVLAIEAAAKVARSSAEASFVFLNMLDLLFRISTIYFANLVAASDQSCRAAHIVKDRGATKLFRTHAIAELKSIHEKMRHSPRI